MSIKSGVWKSALDKVHFMSDESLLAVWGASETEVAWVDNHYNKDITLDEWVELVYCEVSIRKLI